MKEYEMRLEIYYNIQARNEEEAEERAAAIDAALNINFGDKRARPWFEESDRSFEVGEVA